MIGKEERALATLVGMAVGDALGMPTQSLPRSLIVARYGPRITTLVPAPDDHPIAAGLPAGCVTDDTEQALLVANLLIEYRGTIDPRIFAERLTKWEEAMRQRGSQDLLGPSTTRAIANIMAGQVVTESGRYGTTNGAAMRIPPLGVASSIDNLPLLVDRVELVSRLTHNTGLALAGAAAVAAAVSAGVDGASVKQATAIAIQAAGLAESRGFWVAGADVGTRIQWAVSSLAKADDQDPADLIYRLIGTSLAAQESIPAAFAVLAVHPSDPWSACQLAASLGGDTDTISAIVGAIGGACCGTDTIPRSIIETVQAVNHLNLQPVAAALLDLRLENNRSAPEGSR